MRSRIDHKALSRLGEALSFMDAHDKPCAMGLRPRGKALYEMCLLLRSAPARKRKQAEADTNFTGFVRKQNAVAHAGGVGAIAYGNSTPLARASMILPYASMIMESPHEDPASSGAR